MSKCNHILGTDESDGYMGLVYGRSRPSTYGFEIQFAFCPLCGTDITAQVVTYEAACNEERARVQREFEQRQVVPLPPRPPTKPEDYFQIEANRMFPHP